MNKILSILKYIIGWPLSAVSLLFIGKLIYDQSSLLIQIKQFNPFLLIIGILLLLTYFFIRGALWRELLREKGNKFDLIKTIYLWELTEIKRYTPGNIWSFLSRAEVFSKNNVSKRDVASSLLNEVILIILGALTFSFFYISHKLNDPNITKFLLIANILAIAVYSLNKKFNIKLIPKLRFYENLKLYSLSFLTFFVFGLATYFTAASIVYLDPKNVLILSSLFSFSLLIGYLSVLTPMGLGVREAVVTFGLLKYTSLGNAGLIAIFSRIIFIISELLFFVIIYILNKFKNTYLLSILTILRKYKYEVTLVSFVIIYIIYFTSTSFLRHDNFFSGRFDLGNMDQVVWNTINGRIFQLTDPNGIDTVSRLSFHADFILILISPLYFIWSNPKMLLLLQTILLSLGSIFIYLIARNILKNKNISLVLSISYLLYPALQYVNLYDFHPVAFATTFLLATYYFFLKKQYLYFLIFATLSAITKENVWAIISVFGLFIILRSFKNKRIINIKEFFFGAFIFLFSASLFYLLIVKIIPFFRAGDHFALSYYSEFGNTPLEVLQNIILNPLKTFSVVFEFSRLRFLFEILSPLGFISVLNPAILIFVLPDMMISLLSNNVQLRQIYYQYTSSITPFIFISAVYSLKYLISRFKKLTYEKLSVFILLSSLISLYFIGPIAGSKRPNIDMFTKQLDNRKAIEKFISKISIEYSIAATNNLGSHLSQREKIYTIPLGIGDADYVLFLLNDSFAQPSLSAQKEMAKSLEKSENYIMVYKDGDFIAFAKKKN